jgi:hypothetical protein
LVYNQFGTCIYVYVIEFTSDNIFATLDIPSDTSELLQGLREGRYRWVAAYQLDANQTTEGTVDIEGGETTTLNIEPF